MKQASLIRAGGLIAAVGIAAVSLYVVALRPWHRRWGATDEDVERALPGDDLVTEPKLAATHAVTIQARAADIWPWLAQLGQGRGGFYSYELIENKLMGLAIRNADRIIPEFQHIAVGDTVPLAPGGFGLPVVAVEQDRYLVLHGDTRTGSTPVPVAPGDYLNASWTFFLQERPDGTTRLIERFRADYGPRAKSSLFYRVVIEPGSFIMERKMLLGIKQRAENAAARGVGYLLTHAENA